MGMLARPGSEYDVDTMPNQRFDQDAGPVVGGRSVAIAVLGWWPRQASSPGG